MSGRAGRTAMRSAARLSAALALGACALFSRSGQSGTPRSLVINNRTGFEVVVYAVPASGAVGIRLGNAASFGVTSVTFEQSALQNGNDMVVRLHMVGQATGARDWVSPRITLNDDLVARLDIRADSHGDMSTSVFYTSRPASGSIP